MSRDSYLQLNSPDRALSGDSISHPPDDEDLCGSMTSQPQRNRVGAKIDRTQQPPAGNSTPAGCEISGSLDRIFNTPKSHSPKSLKSLVTKTISHSLI